MFIIEKTTMFRVADQYGDLLDDLDVEYFTGFDEEGHSTFGDKSKAEMLLTESEAKKVVDNLKLSNPTTYKSRVNFEIKEVKENDKYCRQSAS